MLVAIAHRLAERVHQGGLARAHRATDADAKRAVGGIGHERNSLVYWVSWAMAQRSIIGAAVPRSSREAASTAAATSRSGRLEGRGLALAIGLAERDQAHARRDQVGGKAVQERHHRGVQRQAVGGRRHARDHGVGRCDLALAAKRIEGIERCGRPGLA